LKSKIIVNSKAKTIKVQNGAMESAGNHAIDPGIIKGAMSAASKIEHELSEYAIQMEFIADPAYSHKKALQQAEQNLNQLNASLSLLDRLAKKYS